MKRTLLLLLATLYLAVVWPLPAKAGYQYVTLENYPGSNFSFPIAIDGGTMVGVYFPSSPFPCPNTGTRMYTYHEGVWNPLDYPGSLSGDANDIQGGNIVGGWVDGGCGHHGFFFNGSTWTSLDYPGSGGSWALGIDGSNIVGNIFGGVPGNHGFRYMGGSWTLIDHPGGHKTSPHGIEGNNIVGWYTDNSGVDHGFLYNGSTWSTLDYPGAYIPLSGRFSAKTVHLEGFRAIFIHCSRIIKSFDWSNI
jgi:hypothetical protein